MIDTKATGRDYKQKKRAAKAKAKAQGNDKAHVTTVVVLAVVGGMDGIARPLFARKG